MPRNMFYIARETVNCSARLEFFADFFFFLLGGRALWGGCTTHRLKHTETDIGAIVFHGIFHLRLGRLFAAN